MKSYKDNINNEDISHSNDYVHGEHLFRHICVSEW